VCLDFIGGPPVDTEVLITCFDNVVVLAQETVSPGGSISVSGTPLLPTSLSCVVSTLDEATVYQELIFSPRAAFTLKSTFGSLEVEQCGALDCIVDVTYSYTLSNIGEAAINITSVMRTRDGATDELIDLVNPKEIDVGESTVIQDPDVVDYCVAGNINTGIVVAADGEDCSVSFGRRGLLRHAEDIYGKITSSTDQYSLEVDTISSGETH